MDGPQRASELIFWFRAQDGSLNPDIEIADSTSIGLHFRASAAIPAGSKICEAPHSTSLSYLNALVDDKYPVFKKQRHDFTIEAIGFWYLMIQYINRTTSFWRPYLETLPPPEQGIPSALGVLLDDAAPEREWLEGTDVLHTAMGRFEVYERYYANGLEILKNSGIDTEPYTWHLFLWAVSMFTSRSFSSRALRPADGNKYWATHKDSTSNPGRRQTVLLDMSHTPAEDLDFSVLFPVLDVGNHNPKASAEWNFEPGRFGLVTHDSYGTGTEVFNNYGTWKPNAELLMGYGFCLADNEADRVLLTPKPPPSDLQDDLRSCLPGYFKPDGTWWGEKATFHIPLVAPPTVGAEHAVFGQLPEPLLELLVYILRHEHGLPFSFIKDPKSYLTDSSSVGNQYLPFVARALVASLAPKIAKVQPPTTLQGIAREPTNMRQRYAAMYRASQLAILESNITALRAYTRSLLRGSSKSNRGRFVTLEGLLEWSISRFGEAKVAQFLAGIEANAGTGNVETLRAAGWEEDMLVVLLCAVFIWSQDSADSTTGPVWPEWVNTAALGAASEDKMDVDSSMEDQVQNLLPLINTASQASKEGGLWRDPRWGAALLGDFGGRMMGLESMLMMVPTANGGGNEEARLVVYLHA